MIDNSVQTAFCFVVFLFLFVSVGGRLPPTHAHRSPRHPPQDHAHHQHQPGGPGYGMGGLRCDAIGRTQPHKVAGGLTNLLHSIMAPINTSVVFWFWCTRMAIRCKCKSMMVGLSPILYCWPHATSTRMTIRCKCKSMMVGLSPILYCWPRATSNNIEGDDWLPCRVFVKKNKTILTKSLCIIFSGRWGCS